MARQQSIPIIALAHHADDQVELFFLRLLRGAGGAGAAGMKPQSPSPADGTIQLVRPLLEFTKAELLAFTREQGIRFRDDASNASPDFLRNRIRHELLPLLRKHYQSGLDRTVLRQMDIIGSESQLVDAIAGDWLLEMVGGKPPDIDRLPVALQRRILHRQLLELGAPADFELVEQLRVSPDKCASLGPDLVVNRDAVGRVELRRTVSPSFNPAEAGGELATRAGHLEFGGRKFAWQIRPQKRFRPPSGPTGREVFDAARVGSHFQLRHWRPGDRFQPLGMKTAVKLQDLFVNARVPRDQRHVRVVATTRAGDIFWVEGLRPGEPFKVTPATLRQLVWHWSVLPV
jgi:tRNA(Ile)-lysidine synthase